MTSNKAGNAANIADIRRTSELLFSVGQVVELRSPGTTKGVISGYFDDMDALAATATELSGNVPGVYVTLNPFNVTLLARAKNRVINYAKITTSDKDILRRLWLPIDLDPVRPSGISASEGEHQTALDRAAEVNAWLQANIGFPESLIADSGNGAHLLARVELPNTPESTALIKKCLEALALRFTDDRVAVDLTTCNPARIWKLYGTRACKGDDTPERSHRLASLIDVPEKIEVASADLLKKLAAMAPQEPKCDQAYRGNGHKPFDIDSFIAKSGLEISVASAWNGGRKWILKNCPWNSDHQNRSAFVLQFPNGAVDAGCHHNGCAGKGWHDLRDIVEPGWREKRKDHNGDGKTHTTQSSTAYPYAVDGGRIVRYRQTKDAVVVDSLCNFDAQIKEEIILDDGADATRAFIIEGRLDSGSSLPSVRIPASRFSAMTWVTESWGMRSVVRAGNGTRDYLREAIQRLSPDAQVRHVFTHTGWRKIDNQWIYLSGSTTGNADFEVDLGPELARYKLPAVANDPVGAMQLSLDLLKIAPLRITAPLFAACYRAPLVSAFPQDLSIWVEGTTGSMKSTMAALFLSHFGDFDRIHLPGAWASTANQLERRAFLLKDSLFVIDDYAPTALDHREIEMKASRLLRAQGNLAGRARLRSDLTERSAFYPRGIIISTGEQHPPGQSLLARTLVIELDRNDIDIATLTDIQKQAGRLSHAMAGYIQWLAPQMDQMPALLRQAFLDARTRATAGAEHLRIPEAAAHLWLGLHCGLTYAQEIGAITEADSDRLLRDGWDAFIEIGREQAAVVEQEDPVRRFLTVLHTILTQGRAVIVATDENTPEQNPGVDFLGWFDAEWLYLMPEATFAAVVRFCRDSGEHFPIRQERLKKDLAKNCISECHASRLTATARIGGHIKRVLKLNIEKVESTAGVTGVTACNHCNHFKMGERDGL
ncbi:MAG: hypothetical protein Q8S00_04795 [Deltaproteobacteria bacterium]|nr:hypothetical protein [Deltaproteobacteria bacterium]